MKALLGFLLALLVAGGAQANPLRMHGLPIGTFNQTLSIRGTQNQIVDMTAATAACSSTELINVSTTGPVSGVGWASQYLDLNAQTWRKQELTNFTWASTSGASDAPAASTWTIGCSGGTYKIGFNVASPDILDWNYGAKTLIRLGGAPLYDLPISSSYWEWQPSSTDQCALAAGGTDLCSNLYENTGERIVIRCLGPAGGAPTTTATGNCPSMTSASHIEGTTGNGPYSNSAATAAAVPLTGTNAVVIKNAALGLTRTISLHMTAHEFDIAPPPAWFATSGTGIKDGNQLVPTALAAKNCGDKVLAEVPVVASPPAGLVFDYGQNSTTPTPTTISFTSGSVPTAAAVACPIVNAAYNDPGWVQYTPREPYRAQITALALDTTSATGATNNATYDRWTGWDTYTGQSASPLITTVGIRHQTSTRGAFHEIDHNKMAWFQWRGSSATFGDGLYNTYVVDNDLDNGVTNQLGIFFSWDGKLRGNHVWNTRVDAMDFVLLDSNLSTQVSEISYNFNQNIWDGCAHTDNYQEFLQSGIAFGLDGGVGLLHGPREYGNVITPGTPSVLTESPVGIGNITFDGTTTNMVVNSVASGTFPIGSFVYTASSTPVQIVSGPGGGGPGTYVVSAVPASFTGTGHALPNPNNTTNTLPQYFCFGWNLSLLGETAASAQGLFNVPVNPISSTVERVQMVGNLVITTYVIGVFDQYLGDGTVIRDNTVTYADYISASTGLGGLGLTFASSTGNPTVGTSGPGAIVAVDENTQTGSGNLNKGTAPFTPPNAVEGSNGYNGNVINAVSANTWVNPFNPDHSTRAKVMSHYATKAGGPQVGKWDPNSLNVVDIRGETFDAQRFAPINGQAPAMNCTTQPVVTISGTFPHVVGDIVTLSVASVWTGGPTTVTPAGGFSKNTPSAFGTSLCAYPCTTYTLQSADVTGTSRALKVYYIEYDQNAQGGMVCGSLQIPGVS